MSVYLPQGRAAEGVRVHVETSLRTVMIATAKTKVAKAVNNEAKATAHAIKSKR